MSHFISYMVFTALVGILLLLNWLGIFRTIFGIDTAIILTLIAGYKIIYNSISSLLNKKINADVAISIAAITALAIGEYVAAAEAMFIMLVGEGLEEFAARRTRTAMEKLVALVPQTARVYRDGAEQEIPIGQVLVGDVVMARAGERIPVDGAIISGRSYVDESTITGESIPAEKGVDGEVFTGTINGLGPLEIRVTRVGEDTTLAKVIRLMKEAEAKKAPIERTADRYAKYFLPAVLFAAGAAFFFSRDWIRAVSILIVACPCALILATPAAVVAAIGRLAREGILVKGGNYIEQMAQVDCLVFDKTGTLTEGEPALSSIITFNSQSPDDVLRLAAVAERKSEHLMAHLLTREAEARGLAIADLRIADFTVHPGLGVEASHDSKRILVGNRLLMETKGVLLEPAVEEALSRLDAAGQTSLLVAEDKSVIGVIGVEDQLRPEVRPAVKELKELGIKKISMLTGDRERIARTIARKAGIDDAAWQLLPEEKVERVRSLQQQGFKVAMLGDGINDAPSLAAADVGIAMGGIGTDITTQAADIVLMTDRVDKLPILITLSRRTLNTIKQNILWFAFVVNATAVGAAFLGLIGPVASAVVHQVSSFLVILNSLRLLITGKFSKTKLGGKLIVVWEKSSAAWERGNVVAFDKGFAWLSTRRRAIAAWLSFAGVSIYLLSGVYIVSPDEIAVVQRFGRKMEPFMPPGLHYHWPWPVERITKVKSNRIQAVEIGFRTLTNKKPQATQEPAAYEWNIQHRSGRYEKRAEEALMLTGDENLVEMNVIVQYTIDAPDNYIFAVSDPESLVRTTSEGVIHRLVAEQELETILTTGRSDFERKAEAEVQRKLKEYVCGVAVRVIRLQDVHPSIEVVDAFRDVASAFEEKNKLINEAEAYYKEQVLLARGQAKARLEGAQAYTYGRIHRASGEAERFKQAQDAYRAAPAVTETRLYLETVEQILPGKNKFIVDSRKVGRRQIFLMDSNGLKLNTGALEEKLAKEKKAAGNR